MSLLIYSKNIINLNHIFFILWKTQIFWEIFIFHNKRSTQCFYKIPSFYIINLHLKRQYTISAFEFAMIYSGCTDKIYRLHQHSQYKTVHSSLQQQTKSLQILQNNFLIISTALKTEKNNQCRICFIIEGNSDACNSIEMKCKMGKYSCMIFWLYVLTDV